MKEIWCELFEEFKEAGLPCEEAAREADHALTDRSAELIDAAVEADWERRLA